MIKYSEYIQSQEWKAKRESKLFRAGYKCEKCGRDDIQLEVHHKTYERLGHEWITDLIVLCEDCHKSIHNKIVLPDNWWEK